MALLFVALAIFGALVLRGQAKNRIERDSLARRPVGPDGIVIGGQPIALDGAGPGAVLLLHGFGDTPQSLAPLARALHDRGWTVRAPLLAGHGRTIRDFARSGASEWLADARHALADLRSRSAGGSEMGGSDTRPYSAVAIGGLSMGGSLAAILAADDPTLAAVALLAPYVEMPAWMRIAAHAHWLIDGIVPYLYWFGETRSIRDPLARAQSLCNTGITARVVAQLATLTRDAQAALPRVTVPTLIMQSPDDNRIPPAVAYRALDRLGAHDRQLVWAKGTHVITVDEGAEDVARTVGEFLDTHVMQYNTQRVVDDTRYVATASRGVR